MENLEKKSVRELLAIYNEVSGGDPLRSWKRKKAELVEMIRQKVKIIEHDDSTQLDGAGDEKSNLPKQSEGEVVNQTDTTAQPEGDSKSVEALQPSSDEGDNASLLPEQGEGAAVSTETPDAAASVDKTETVPVPAVISSPTVKSVALDWLLKINYYEDVSRAPGPGNVVTAEHEKAGSVGYSYGYILQRIYETLPGAKTSVACLRWYCSKVRDGAKGYEGTLPRRRPRS